MNENQEAILVVPEIPIHPFQAYLYPGKLHPENYFCQQPEQFL